MNLKILLAVLLLTLVFCFAGTALAMTEAERQTLIAQIQQQIISLQAQVAQMITQQQGNSAWCHTFNNNLGYANSGSAEVGNLHIALQKEGIFYNPDDIYTYSSGTSQAIIQFQTKYGISPQSGFTGPLTRTKLNQLYGCAATNLVIPTPNPVTCAPNWQCTTWSSCSSNNQQTRTCFDYNYCGVLTNRPSYAQSCTSNTANNCVANCVTQADGVYAINCYGNVTKCSQGQICEQTFNTNYTYNSNAVQTARTLTGAQCKTPATTPTPTPTPPPNATDSVCANSNWAYILSPFTCPLTGIQTKTWSKIGNCSGGVSHPVTETASCAYQANTCVSFTYSAWSDCSQSGNQIRTVISSAPSGCVGGNPIISGACTPDPITVISPNGGEHWTVGQRYNITWTSTGIYGSPYVSLSLLNSAGTEVYNIGRTRLDARTYSWIIPSIIYDTKGPGAYRLKIVTQIMNSTNQYTGLGNSWFSILPAVVQPSITRLSSPGAPIGTNITIFGQGFTSTGNNIKFSTLTSSGAVLTGYYQNGIAHSGGTAITFSIPASLKTCPLLAGQSQCSGAITTPVAIYNIMVVNANGSSNEVRLGVFGEGISVDSLPSIAVAYPNGGGTWQVGSTQQVGWITKNVISSDVDSVLFFLRDEMGNGYYLSNVLVKLDIGLANISVPSTIPPGVYKLELHISINDLVYSDDSDVNLSIIAAP